jgi:hypothetical protein
MKEQRCKRTKIENDMKNTQEKIRNGKRGEEAEEDKSEERRK